MKDKGKRPADDPDISGLLLLANVAERFRNEREKERDPEEEEASMSLFPFLHGARYRRKPVGWLEAMFRCRPGHSIKVLCVKKLTPTDTSDHHSRLLIPKGKERSTILGELTEEENEKVMDENGEGLVIPTLDARGQPWTLHCKYWHSNNALVLKKDWLKIVKSNGLEEKIDSVELRSFRQNASEMLCLVVIGHPSRGGEENENGGRDRQ